MKVGLQGCQIGLLAFYWRFVHANIVGFFVDYRVAIAQFSSMINDSLASKINCIINLERLNRAFSVTKKSTTHQHTQGPHQPMILQTKDAATLYRRSQKNYKSIQPRTTTPSLNAKDRLAPKQNFNVPSMAQNMVKILRPIEHQKRFFSRGKSQSMNRQWKTTYISTDNTNMRPYTTVLQPIQSNQYKSREISDRNNADQHDEMAADFNKSCIKKVNFQRVRRIQKQNLEKNREIIDAEERASPIYRSNKKKVKLRL